MIDLVIGSNAYLGINLCKKLDPGKTLLVSRGDNDKHNRSFHFLGCNLLYTELEIKEQVKRVFILARSESTKEEEQMRFYDNLEKSILQLIIQNPSIEIHFISTSLVYASHENKAYDKNTEAAPEALYEKMKYAFEEQLRAMQKKNKHITVRVYRIPLLIGGVLRASDRQRQILYAFYQDFKDGHFWVFPDTTTKQYGTAWLDVEEMCRYLIDSTNEKSFRIHLPFSGNLTYYQFMRESHQKLMFPSIQSRHSAPASFMQMASEDQWGKREFWSVFKP